MLSYPLVAVLEMLSRSHHFLKLYCYFISEIIDASYNI